MGKTYTITARHNPQIFRDVAFKGGVVKYSFDFAPWAQDAGGDVTAVTWVVKAGTASVSGAALTSNVASALVTFGDQGGSLIKLSATTASSGTYIAYLDVLAKDPQVGTDDYGITV